MPRYGPQNIRILVALPCIERGFLGDAEITMCCILVDVALYRHTRVSLGASDVELLYRTRYVFACFASRGPIVLRPHVLH